jgi:hypothetical protein
VVPLIVGLKNRSTLLWLYPLTGLIFDVSITLFKRVLHVNHKWPLNLFVLLEFLIISLLYRKAVFKNNTFFSWFVALFGVAFIANTISTSLTTFNVLGTSIAAFVYIVYCLCGFYRILQAQEVIYLEKSWFFWLNVALTIYASGSFLVFLFMNYLETAHNQLFLKIWGLVFLTLNITKNLLIAVALYHYKPAQRESH